MQYTYQIPESYVEMLGHIRQQENVRELFVLGIVENRGGWIVPGALPRDIQRTTGLLLSEVFQKIFRSLELFEKHELTRGSLYKLFGLDILE